MRNAGKTLFVLALVVAVTGLSAQGTTQKPKPFEPFSGQAGKDVVWVPTPQELVEKMLDLAKLTPKDFLMDLGSGDGRTVITAAKRGAHALGIEYNPDMVELSRRNAEAAGVSKTATFQQADLFETDFSKADVVTMFLLPSINMRLRPTILKMKPGTRVVSNTFTMGDWEPDQTVQAPEGCKSFCRAHLWIVPAQVAGSWQLGESELSLVQTYQTFTGKLVTGNVVAPIKGRLDGDRIAFTAAGTEYTGQVSGGAMEGTASKEGAQARWQAARR